MHNLSKYLPTPSMKINNYKADNWKSRDQELYVNEIRFAIKDGLPSYMQDELEDNQEEYYSLTHEDWCDLLSTIEVKDNRKRESTDIKKIGYARAASLSNSKGSFRILRKNKARTGFLQLNKGLHNKAHNHHGNQIHCVLCKKSGMPEQKYMWHSAE